MSKQTRPTPAIDLFLPSANIIKQNLPVYFVLLVVPLLLSNLTAPMPELSAQPTFRELVDAVRATITPYTIAGSLLSLLFFPPLMYAEWKTSSKSKEISLFDVARGSQHFYWRLLGLLFCIIPVVAIGFFFFIIPGFIFLRSFVLAPFFMLEKDLGIIESMRLAARKTKPRSWSIYSIFAVMALLGFLSSIGVFGLIIGTILTVLYSLALPLRFHEIKK